MLENDLIVENVKGKEKMKSKENILKVISLNFSGHQQNGGLKWWTDVIASEQIFEKYLRFSAEKLEKLV